MCRTTDEGPGDEEPPMAMRRVLLRAHDADAEARDAIEQALDPALVELLRLDAVVVDLSLGVIALARLRAATE